MPSARRTAAIAALAALPAAIAYRFAVVYRARAGFPRRHEPNVVPSEVGLPYENLVVHADGVDLPAWFLPAEGGRRGPGVVLVHGWESARDRTLPNARFLHAAGFHVLTIDVRGHGTNPPEHLPISGGEFGADARAAVAAILARPEVERAAILGHSMGGIGAVLAAAGDPRIDAIVVVSAPADPTRLTRQTFRLAHLPIPGIVAWPLAWLTARIYVRPRGHVLEEVSASRAIARYRGPALLVHGAEDEVVPIGHHHRLAAAARHGRAVELAPAPVETLVLPEGRHSWLYEDATYRRTVAAFLSRQLGGPLPPAVAGERAAAVDARRLPEVEQPFSTIEGGVGRTRTFAQLLGRRIVADVGERPEAAAGTAIAPGTREPEPVGATRSAGAD